MSGLGLRRGAHFRGSNEGRKEQIFEVEQSGYECGQHGGARQGQPSAKCSFCLHCDISVEYLGNRCDRGGGGIFRGEEEEARTESVVQNINGNVLLRAMLIKHGDFNNCNTQN